MSPPRFVEPPSTTAAQTVARVAAEVGVSVREARIRRGWTVRVLAERAGVDPSEVYRLESGRVGSVGAYARVSVALGLRLEVQLTDPRRRDRPIRAEDPVHAAMGDLQAGHLSALVFPVAVDEPFQHFQFAGVPMSSPGRWSGAHCSTSRTGRDSRTCRRRPAATTPSAPTWRRSSPSGWGFEAAGHP